MNEYYKAQSERTDENERLLIPAFKRTKTELASQRAAFADAVYEASEPVDCDDSANWSGHCRMRDEGRNPNGDGESYAERNT